MNSVCLATYNGARYCRQLLDSVLPQLSPTDEIIVCDDGSSDATVSIIESYEDPRIRVYSNPSRLGVVRNFERALYLCSGDTVLLADQDDWWHPQKVARIQEGLLKDDMVISDAFIVDEQGNDTGHTLFERVVPRRGLLANLWKNSYVGCCMAFRRSLLEKALPFPACLPMHDSWIGLIAEATASATLLPDRLVYYRRHGANLSETGSKSTRSMLSRLRDRLCLSYHIARVITR
jgi:GT2 family glycosyltransferase